MESYPELVKGGGRIFIPCKKVFFKKTLHDNFYFPMVRGGGVFPITPPGTPLLVYKQIHPLDQISVRLYQIVAPPPLDALPTIWKVGTISDVGIKMNNYTYIDVDLTVPVQCYFSFSFFNIEKSYFLTFHKKNNIFLF